MKELSFIGRHTNTSFYVNTNKYIGKKVVYGVTSFLNFTEGRWGMTRNEIVWIGVSPKIDSVLSKIENKSALPLPLFLKKIFPKTKKIVLRLQSECYFGMLGDTHCDCEDQRLEFLKNLRNIEHAIFVFLPQEGKGNGLQLKAAELHLQIEGRLQDNRKIGEGFSHLEAVKYLNIKYDSRNYDFLPLLLTDLGIPDRKFVFITDNKRKAEEVKRKGVNIVEILPTSKFTSASINIENTGEYLHKILQGYRVLSEEESRYFEIIYKYLQAILPSRARKLINEILKKPSKKFYVEKNKQFSIPLFFDQNALENFISKHRERVRFYIGKEYVLKVELYRNKDFTLILKYRANTWRKPYEGTENKILLLVMNNYSGERWIYSITTEDADNIIFLLRSINGVSSIMYPIISWEKEINNYLIPLNLKIFPPKNKRYKRKGAISFSSYFPVIVEKEVELYMKEVIEKSSFQVNERDENILEEFSSSCPDSLTIERFLHNILELVS